MSGRPSSPELTPPDSRLLARARERREKVLETLGDRAALVLPATPELRAGRDIELPYIVDPELYYLTGVEEPEAVAVLLPGTSEARFVLFVRARDPERELWTGPRGGPERATSVFGADEAYPLAELETRLPGLLHDADTVYFRVPSLRPDVERVVLRAVSEARSVRQRSGVGPRGLVDPGAVLDELRLVKDEDEIGLLRTAAQISVEAFRQAAPTIRAGVGEWQIQAALEAAFRRGGADGPAFGTIVASGAAATVLHYVANRGVLDDGELVLVDAGARLDGYSADISRTYPVSGRFGAEQRSAYDIVLAAHDAAIVAARPGASVADVHGAALDALLAGLVELGALQGGVAGLREQPEAFRPFFPHRTSHWLGLEVHDVGDYSVEGEPRRLEAGMVLTIEPGLYFRATSSDTVPAGLRGTGIRLEDDVLVTSADPEVLTAGLPIRAEDVERMLRDAS